MASKSPKFLTEPRTSGGQEYISFAELARRLTVQVPSIMEAKRKKWFTVSNFPGTKTPCAKWPQARDEYLECASRGRNPKSFAKAVRASGANITQEKALENLAQREADPENAPEVKGRGRSQLHSIAKASESRMFYDAALKQLEWEKKAGLLVPVTAVEKVWLNIAGTLKTALLALPERMSPILKGETEIHRIKMLLRTEIDEICKTLEVKHEYVLLDDDESDGDAGDGVPVDQPKAKSTVRTRVAATRRKVHKRD